MPSKDALDPYELLGVSRNASPEEINKAFKRESLRWHPDRGDGDEESFKALVDARDRLLARASGPYLTPGHIAWTANATHQPEPVTVRLSYPGDDVPNVKVDPTMGNFWMITSPTAIMEGGDLYDFVIAPVGVEATELGLHEDEVSFVVDERVVKLPISLIVPAATSRPQTALDLSSVALNQALASVPSLSKPTPPTIGFGHHPFEVRLVLIPFLFVGLYLMLMAVTLILALAVTAVTPLTMANVNSADDTLITLVVVTAAILAIVAPLGGLDLGVGMVYRRRLRRFQEREAERARIRASFGLAGSGSPMP